MELPIYISLVDDDDHIIGAAEKLEVHERGLLHRAFSILVFNRENELLIHQRALHKYHSGGLWTNTCCGHPNKNEDMEAAVHRRLREEMGFDCALKMRFKFRYRAAFPNGLVENEIDHVYIGQFDETFTPNPDEVADHEWVDLQFLNEDVQRNPGNYTVWFREILHQDALAEIISLH